MKTSVLFSFKPKGKTFTYSNIEASIPTDSFVKKRSSILIIAIAYCLIISIIASLTTSTVQANTVDSLITSKVTYAAEDGLYLTNLNGDKATLLVKGAEISSPVFSNDGKVIAFMQKRSLYAFNLNTSKSSLILRDVDSYCPGQGSEFFVSSKNNGIIMINPQTAKSSTVIPLKKDTSYMHLQASPNFKLLAYDTILSGIDNQKNGGTWLYDTTTKKARMIVKAISSSNTSLGTRSTVAKWSPDSKKILIWLMSQSASLSADGVSPAIYDLENGRLAELDKGALAYNENTSFASPSSLALITGGSRMMFERKNLTIFNTRSGKSIRELKIPDKVPTTPCYSSDGKQIVFAACPVAKADDTFKNQKSAIAKRQIYMYLNGSIIALTNDNTYRSEAPFFLKDNKHIVFARVNINGEKSLWRMDTDGHSQKLLAKWAYKDPEDMRSTDFYGRIDWSNMYAVFDNTKADN